MKKFLLALAFGGLAILPTAAQDVRVRAGQDGITIRSDVAQGYSERRRWERDRRRSYERRRERCRWVTERRVRPSGRVVITRYQRCF